MEYNKFMDGKIYKLINDEGQCYYGSTTMPLNKRFCDHRSSAKTNNKPSISKFIFEGTNPRIILVEDSPCETKQELLTREAWFIKNNECINTRPPIVTKEQTKLRREKYMKPYCKDYYEENKEKLKIRSKEHYEQNKERISVEGKERVECSCGVTISRASLNRHLKSDRHIKLLKA